MLASGSAHERVRTAPIHPEPGTIIASPIPNPDAVAARKLRLSGALLTAIVTFVAVVIGIAAHQSWRNLLAREGAALGSATSQLAATVDLRLETVARGLDLVIASAPGSARPEAAATLRQLRALDPRVGAVALTDGAAMLARSEAPPDLDPEILARLARAAFERHVARPGAALLLTPALRPENANVFVVSCAMHDAGGALAGIALVTMPIDDLVATVAEVLARDGGRATLLDDEYRVISRWPLAALGADLSGTPISLAIRNGPPADVIRARSTIDGASLLTAYARSPHFPFTVVMSKDLPRILRIWRDQQKVEFAVLASLLLGTGLAALAMHRAIRRQLAAEQAQRDAERARFGRALEGARDGLAIWNADGRLVSWNSRFAEIGALLDLRPVLGRPLDEIFAVSPQAAKALADVALDPHGARAVELPDGVVVEIAHRREASGDAVTTLRDVSAERAAQRQLAASEARFRDGIESMAEGFILWDRADRMVAWNRQAELLLPIQAPLFRVGLHFEETLSHLARFNGGHERRELWLAELDERRRRRTRLGKVATFRTSTGRTIESIDRATADGGIVSTFRDVTEQRQLLDRLQNGERELRRALAAERDMNSQQRRFVAMASHEFRTPLAIIDSAAQRIQTVIVDAGAETGKRLARIRAAVSRMTEIIDRTLATARLDEGRMEMKRERCDVVALAREVARRQQTITPDFAVRLDADAEEIVVDADIALLDQVLTNLLSNAVKYTRPVAPVDLHVGATPDEVVIGVTDRGIGIPSDEIDLLFNRFFRSRLAAGIGGTGIGLYLVREFVGMHGGTIDVRSEVGRGSTFTVRLPRRSALAAVA